MEPERFAAPLFRPYQKLIEIRIRDQKFLVPENQILLRAFQYLCPNTIPYGRYCWNEECQFCRVSVRRPGSRNITQAISCKLMAEEGLEVVELSEELRWNLRLLFLPATEEMPPSGDS